MSTNMELITSVTVGSGGAASVTLPATGTIPQTYTDLMLVISGRTDRAAIADGFLIKPNNTTPTIKYITGDGTTAYSGTNYSGIFPAATATASTFGNSAAYFPNYANTSYNKSFSVDDVSENNATNAYTTLSANLYSSTSAITTIVVQSINAANIVEGSTFYLYGISNVTSTTKATGGIVSSDGTYNYHMFPYSGTFTPTTAISADILCIAGGGAGGLYFGGGGGGAGGVLEYSAQSLTATGYTVTVGAGGAGYSSLTAKVNGSNSQFGSLTASVGGGGGAFYADAASAVGANGGSGGAGSAHDGTSTSGAGGTATSGQGSNGGSGFFGGGAIGNGGGGGGKGATGSNAGNNFAGNGGAGSNTWLSWANATQTGVNGYYAGGGGGGTHTSAGTRGLGGLGGGGNGSRRLSPSEVSSGTVNTGSGGGGQGDYPGYLTGSGGSGLVIIRYAI